MYSLVNMHLAIKNNHYKSKLSVISDNNNIGQPDPTTTNTSRWARIEIGCFFGVLIAPGVVRSC